MTPEEADALAGEYVLGTLSAIERQAFERALARDAALQAVVAQWDRRLSALDEGAEPVVPGAAVWTRIASALPRPQPTAAAGEPPLGASPPAGVVDLASLRRSRALWRGWALGASALAAGLAVAVLLQPLGRPAAPTESYVAVVNRGGDQPALIVRVDLRNRTVLIRPVAADPPAGRSLELWYIGPGQSPRSMGVLPRDSREVPFPANLDGGSPAGLTKATFAVTAEPPGGSPSGGPTGPVLYSGELIRE